MERSMPTAGVEAPTSVGMRVAGLASVASAVIAAVAVILLILMFGAFGAGATSAGQAVGAINDVLTLVAYLLAAPGVVATWALLRQRRPVLAGIGALLALGAIAAIVVLQWQLVSGALTFDQQIGPVSVAFLILGAWFVLSAHIGAGLLPYGVGIGVMAALYFGYPVLAFRLGIPFVEEVALDRRHQSQEGAGRPSGRGSCTCVNSMGCASWRQRMVPSMPARTRAVGR